MNVAILGLPCHNGKLKFENKKGKQGRIKACKTGKDKH
jgi:hypothetical protein